MMMKMMIIFIGKFDKNIFLKNQIKKLYIKNEKNNFKNIIINNNK